jgi:hypothetical protein
LAELGLRKITVEEKSSRRRQITLRWQENLAQNKKKNSSRENRKRWRIFDPVGKLLIRKTN